jgi:hypothetical protein
LFKLFEILVQHHTSSDDIPAGFVRAQSGAPDRIAIASTQSLLAGGKGSLSLLGFDLLYFLSFLMRFYSK